MKNKKLEEILQNRNAKIILAIVLLLIVLIPILIKVSPQKSNKILNNDKNKEVKSIAHTDAEIIKEEEFEGIKFSNIALITAKGYTTFTADVTNVTEEEITKENYNIDLKDKNGNVVTTLIANIPNGLKPNETKTVTATAKGEFKNVVSKTIRE